MKYVGYLILAGLILGCVGIVGLFARDAINDLRDAWVQDMSADPVPEARTPDYPRPYDWANPMTQWADVRDDIVNERNR